MTHIAKWRQKELIGDIKAQVTENMETAAKMIEVDARHRLLRIREPAWGLGYRRVLALFRLTSRVKVERHAVEGQIGMPVGRKGRDDGFWIEVGSKSAAAQPWLRPALLTNLRDLLALLGGK